MGNGRVSHTETHPECVFYSKVYSLVGKDEVECLMDTTITKGTTDKERFVSFCNRLNTKKGSTRRSSSDLIHDASWSGTDKAMDSTARHVRNCRMVRHPSTGWNLSVSGVDSQKKRSNPAKTEGSKLLGRRDLNSKRSVPDKTEGSKLLSYTGLRLVSSVHVVPHRF